MPHGTNMPPITGQKFGMLLALERGTKSPRKWVFKCDCGRVKEMEKYAVYYGYTKSCGCIRAQKNTKHGMTESSEYIIWGTMVKRCTNPKSKSFPDYGGRGIKVCPDWLTFTSFIRDMGPKPSPQHTLDRIDNSGNYEPSNCRWATRAVQARNQRRNVNCTFNGVTKCLTDWASELGVHYATLRRHVAAGKHPFLKLEAPLG